MDEADVNAVRQTALAILYSCVLPPPGAPHREYVFNEDRGSGGWQIAGKIAIILFFPFHKTRKLPVLNIRHGTYVL